MELRDVWALDTLFPPGVIVEIATDADSSAPLYDEEARYVANAVPTRVREYRQGRAAARRALGKLGVAPMPIPSGTDRAPQWPDGIVGSIAHTDGRCAAALSTTRHYRGLGLDIERARPLPQDIREAVCTPAEREWIATQSDGLPWGMLTFAVKEAFYKAWYPLTRTFIGFHDVAVRFDPETAALALCESGGHCSADALADYRGRWARDDQFLYVGVFVSCVEPR